MTYPVRTGLAEIVDPPDLASSITICENEHLNERNAEKVERMKTHCYTRVITAWLVRMKKMENVKT